MTSTSSSRLRATLAAALVLLAATLTALSFSTAADAHGKSASTGSTSNFTAPYDGPESEDGAVLAGDTLAHARADGIIGGKVDAKRWMAAKRAYERALNKRNRQMRAKGVTLLTDEQIRQRVLMQSLGIPVPLSYADGTGGYASATATYSLDSSGNVADAPTAAAAAGISNRAAIPRTVTTSERATKGEWSLPVQPNYQTYGSATFPNSQYSSSPAAANFPGDPIVNTDQDYKANPDNTGLVNARYWSPNPRIVPIFEAMLPNGKVIYWDWYFSGNMNDGGQTTDGGGTRVLIWDPAHPNNPGVRKDVPGANLFCAGYTQLPNGDVVLVGGNANENLEGLKTTFVYHWRTGTWEQTDNMYRTRWYPSVSATWNGESLIVGGDPPDENGQYTQINNPVPEVYDSAYDNSTGQQTFKKPPYGSVTGPNIRTLGGLSWPWDSQDGPHVPGWRLYPFLIPWTDGRVLYAGRETPILLVDPRVHGDTQAPDPNAPVVDSPDCTQPTAATAGAYPDPGGRNQPTCNDGGDRYATDRDDGQNNGGRNITRSYGSAAYYGLGKVLVTGGDQDRLYDWDVPPENRGPGFDTFDPATDPPVDDGDGPDPNWVCKGYAGGNPYLYTGGSAANPGNPYDAITGDGNYVQWSGEAPLVHVWNKAWCAGTNTLVPDNLANTNPTSNSTLNGASKESSLISMSPTSGNLDFGNPTAPGWPTSKQTSSMTYPRRMANLTVLPNDKLVSTGGIASTNAPDDAVTASEDGYPGETSPQTYGMWANDQNVNTQLVNYNRAVLASEQWDPDTKTWSVMDSEHLPRQYHSTTVLLPDGRLMSGGGGVCSTCTYALYSEANFEFYSPTYLFWKTTDTGADDAPQGTAKTAAQRPAITGPLHTEGLDASSSYDNTDNSASLLPATDYDGTLNVTYTKGLSYEGTSRVPVTKAVLIKLGDPTHGFDQGQRYVDVSATFADNNDGTTGTATIKAPPNPYEAPPGFYWLFLLDKNGTPSVAKAVQIGAHLALENKTKTATAYAEEGLSDPLPQDDSSSQDFGLGSYYASQGNLLDVRDNSMSSIEIDAGFYATLCRGETIAVTTTPDPSTDQCIRVPAGKYTDFGPRWEDHISSLRIEEGADPDSTAVEIANKAALDDNDYVDQPPAITVSSPADDTTVAAGTTSIAVNYTFTDDVSEADDPDSTTTCDLPSGHVFALNPGPNVLQINCTDGAGNVGTASINVTVAADITPPWVNITAPDDNATTTTNSTQLWYNSGDDVPTGLSCAPANGATVPLNPGANTLTVTCRDAAGNTASDSVHITFSPAPIIRSTVAKKTKIAKKLKFKVLCEAQCDLAIGVTGGKVSWWPKHKIVKASTKTQAVTISVPTKTYKQIVAALKKKKKVKLGLWLNDKRQGYTQFKK